MAYMKKLAKFPYSDKTYQIKLKDLELQLFRLHQLVAIVYQSLLTFTYLDLPHWNDKTYEEAAVFLKEECNAIEYLNTISSASDIESMNHEIMKVEKEQPLPLKTATSNFDTKSEWFTKLMHKIYIELE